jgi:DNA-binding CsgD family transcriptional regulator
MLERDPDAVVAEAAYQLGALSTAGGLRRKQFFGGIATILKDATSVEAAGVMAFPDSVLRPASAVGVAGPWTEHEHAAFLEQTRWAPDDRLLSTTLARSPGPLFRSTNEIVEESVFRQSRIYNEFQRPRGIGEQAQMCLESSDGAHLYVAFARVGSNEPISRRSMEIAQRVAVLIQRCWHVAHAHTPKWARELSPRRRRVLELVSDGLDDHQIAEALDVKYHTVRAHLKDLFREAGVRSRLHLIQAIRLDDVWVEKAAPPSPSEAPAN